MDICDAASSNLQGMESPFAAARYHSLVIEKDSCPGELEVTAWTEDGTIMAVRHRKYPHIQARMLSVEGACMGCGACKTLCLVTCRSCCLRPQLLCVHSVLCIVNTAIFAAGCNARVMRRACSSIPRASSPTTG